ncbi:MAG: hypothetical protein K2I81_03130 [Alphaproteobacteria bacterium]|nr:hypothetical protein [Alphaproteobacteria bacterium]
MKKNTASASLMPDADNNSIINDTSISEAEFPAPLIYKLSEFYRRWPDYPTSIVDIVVLSRLAHTELDKFLHRPHRQVTQIYFDNEGGDNHKV